VAATQKLAGQSPRMLAFAKQHLTRNDRREKSVRFLHESPCAPRQIVLNSWRKRCHRPWIKNRKVRNESLAHMPAVRETERVRRLRRQHGYCVFQGNGLLSSHPVSEQMRGDRTI
jgi:hypothetical protein